MNSFFFDLISGRMLSGRRWMNPNIFGSFCSSAWVAAGLIGSALIGGAVSMSAANKAQAANQAAIDANSKNVSDTNAMNYQRWLESQGVGSNGQAINTWLPRYATLGSNFGSSKKRFRRVGSGSSGSVYAASYPQLGGGAPMPGIASFGNSSSTPQNNGAANYVPDYLREFMGGRTSAIDIPTSPIVSGS